MWYEGWRFNEWQAASIYFTDILLMVLLLFWAYNFFFSRTPKLKIKNQSTAALHAWSARCSVEHLNKCSDEKVKITIKNLKLTNPDFYLFLFIIVSAISIKNSSSQIISWFQWIKLIEFMAFYFYLKNYAFARFNLIQSAWAVISGGVFQSVVGIAQFLKQSSLGLWYLGESLVSIDLRGTAYFLNQAGEKVIRAYGTTPHPNVLAGYLLLVLCIMYYVLWKKLGTHTTHYALYTAYPIILFAFFLTFSRVVILAWAIVFLIGIIIYRKKYPQQIKNIFIATALVAILFSVLFWPEVLSRLTVPADDESLVLRKLYAEEIIRSDISFFGVGVGNSVSWFMDKNPMEAFWLAQPVHNIYLLIYSETGLFGISSFLLFLFLLLKKLLSFQFSTFYFLLSTSFLFIGFFDHFLWTLQQGRFIFWLGLTILSVGDIIENGRIP